MQLSSLLVDIPLSACDAWPIYDDAIMSILTAPTHDGMAIGCMGDDSAGPTRNFAPVITEEPGANITFCRGIFQGPILIFEASAVMT